MEKRVYSIGIELGDARDRDGVMTRRWTPRSHVCPTVPLSHWGPGAMACGDLQSGVGAVQGTRLGR
jgi:hypothetical protein